MNVPMDNTKVDIADVQELAGELEKLPESVKTKILYIIEGAKLVSETEKVR